LKTGANRERRMKILFVGLARSIYLFDTNLLNPKGLSLQPIFEKMTEKYKFAKAPKNALDFDEQKSLSFKSGTFVNSKGTPVLVGYTIYSDGLVADTMSSTDDSTEFLVELTNWIKQDYGLALPAGVKKLWLSQIDFECDIPLVKLNPKLTPFLKSIESRFKPADGVFRRFDVGALNFWTEDVTKPGAPVIVKFERKWQAPFATNHYFSQAPLETREHIELLNELELLLKP
jgi:hypothetical protein